MEKSEPDKKITDIIIICGYLGSGKTTLISYILHKQTKYKVAVIQNEFADGNFFNWFLQLFRDGDWKPSYDGFKWKTFW